MLSIIVPTRNRNITLRETLLHLTSLQIDWDFEILVSDSSGVKAAKAVIDYMNSEKIRYLDPGRPLSMAENYQYAVSKALGDWILIIGDDDLIVESNLNHTLGFLYQTDADLVYFFRGAYYWNTTSPSESNQGNYFYLTEGKCFSKIQSEALISHLESFSLGYYYSPNIYNSIFSKKSYLKFQNNNFSQLLFGDILSPDVFTSLTFPRFFAEVYFFHSQVAVSGLAVSTGMTNGSGSEWERFIAECGDWGERLNRQLAEDKISGWSEQGLRQWRLNAELRFYIQSYFTDQSKPSKCLDAYNRSLRQLALTGHLRLISKEVDTSETRLNSMNYQSSFEYFNTLLKRPLPTVISGYAPCTVLTNGDFANYLRAVNFNINC